MRIQKKWGDLVFFLSHGSLIVTPVKRKIKKQEVFELALEVCTMAESLPNTTIPDHMTVCLLCKELRTVTDPMMLGIGLNIELHILEITKKNNVNDIEGQRIDLLTYIADNHKSLMITWDKIADALEEFLRMGDLAQHIRTKFCCQPRPADSTPPLDPQETALVNPRLSSYRDYLRTRYETHATSTSQWPPVPTTTVIKLAMIKKEKIQRGKIDDQLVRLSITGKVDDILHQKVPVDLENIFSAGVGGGRQFVLIEGAPGSGKSTLALHICQEWGKGKLFQQFDAIVLVRLRDPLVRTAKMIEDILPCRNSSMAHEAATDIVAKDGKGVLWVLDGWDELPTDLPVNSIIHSLIEPSSSQKSSLHGCAVIVTSRPTSSASLHRLVSSRVEILGFTSSELKQYFSECMDGDARAVLDLLERICENPALESSCYIPLNAAIVAHVFLAGDRTLPSSNHEIFTSVVRFSFSRFLQDRLGKQPSKAFIASLDKLPRVLQGVFNELCKLAFFGIVNNKITFLPDDLKAADVSTKVCKVGLLQIIHSILVNSQQVYYCFLHLSIQELLAAIEISRMSPSQQISVFQQLFGQPRFSAVFQFYAGITKLKTYRPFFSLLPRFIFPNKPRGVLELVSNIIKQESKPLLVSLLHCLYEAEDLALCQFVAEEMKKNGTVQLNLHFVTLSPLDCLAVGYFLSAVIRGGTDGQSVLVSLSGCSIGDQGCKFLTRGLLKDLDSHTQNIKIDLYLSFNDIGKEGAQCIAKILENTSVVRALYISSNSIEGEGLKSLCQALVTNSSVTSLYLRYCSLIISEDNGPAISEMLRRNSTLENISLQGNEIFGDRGCHYIADGLKDNESIKTLALSDCGITDRGIEELSAGLNDYIEELYIAGNSAVTIHGLETLMRRLSTPKKLNTVELSKSVVSDPSNVEMFDNVNSLRMKNGLNQINFHSSPFF